MAPSCLVSTVQAAGGGVMVWGMFSWQTLGPSIPNDQRLKATASLNIVADPVHPFMATRGPTGEWMGAPNKLATELIGRHTAYGLSGQMDSDD